MRDENSPWQPLTAAAVEWSADGTPQSSEFGDVYYSRDNGLAESRYVFVEGNGLEQRWRERTAPYYIAETGFGTGLNFLATWQAWLQLPEPRPPLHYLAFELYPLSPQDLREALTHWPELAPLAQALLADYPGLVPGQHRLLLNAGQIRLDLYWGDAGDWLQSLAQDATPLVDSWFLDGFAPAKNHTLWQPELLDCLGRLSRAEASFATFTAAGAVRRALQAAGFAVHKAPGFGRKRECLRGTLTHSPAPLAPRYTPWDRPQLATSKPPRRALVVGAGLAGCWTARALATRGLQVELIDRGPIAGAGSGNSQGVLYTRLSTRHSALTDFAIQSYLFACAQYRALFSAGKLVSGSDGELKGSFHYHPDDDETAYLKPLLEATPELACILDRDVASDRVGAPLASGGYWFEQSGWLHPPAVCRALIDHPNIRIHEHHAGGQLSRRDSNWCLEAEQGPGISADVAVIATAAAATEFSLCDWLPLKVVRGQTTELGPGPWNTLQNALCHEGYIAPLRGDHQTIGATFAPGDDDTEPREADNRANIEQLAAAVPAWRDMLAALPAAELPARAGLRCASPDYLPLVGPLPDYNAFLQRYAELRKNAKRLVPLAGPYMPGLFLNTAHGSRGLTSTPLAAEMLAAQICGEPAPLPRVLQRALAPARFLIRDLGRNRR